VQQIGTTGLAGLVPTSATRDKATGSKSMVLGSWPQGVAEGGGVEEDMADVDEEDEEAAGASRDITIAVIETETATRIATDTPTEIEMAALANDDQSDPAHRCKVIQVNHRGAAHRSLPQG